jgi:hypothetical protein
VVDVGARGVVADVLIAEGVTTGQNEVLGSVRGDRCCGDVVVAADVAEASGAAVVDEASVLVHDFTASSRR